MHPDPEYRALIRDPAVLRRMELAFELYELAGQMKRLNLRRQNPDATEEEFEEGIRAWLRNPGNGRWAAPGGRRARPEDRRRPH